MTGQAETKSDKSPESSASPKQSPDTYFLLETAGNLFIHTMGGLFVQGEENVPKTGPVLMVSNHVSYLDPVGIGVASPRRVVFMAKAELFKKQPLAFLLSGVDCFPVRRGEADRAAFKTTMTMLEEGRVVCIFPEGTRYDGVELGEAEPGAALFAIRTGCPVVPVFVRGSHLVLGKDNKLRREKITVAFGEPFIISKKTDREEGGRQMMEAIGRTRDAFANAPSRQIKPHWFHKKPEGSRAK